jgi:hypothetical protein
MSSFSSRKGRPTTPTRAVITTGITTTVTTTRIVIMMTGIMRTIRLTTRLIHITVSLNIITPPLGTLRIKASRTIAGSIMGRRPTWAVMDIPKATTATIHTNTEVARI